MGGLVVLVLTITLPRVEVLVVVFLLVITLLLSIGDTVEAWLLALTSSAGDEIFFTLSWTGMKGSTGTS